jgi:UDP-glucose 4-epimerase
MRVLVTGGAGFIGSHLVDRLMADGHYVTVVDNLSVGRIENIAHHLDSERFRFVCDSILNVETLEALIRETDRIYHLAAVVGVKYVVEDPLGGILINVRGTENVLELAYRYWVPTLVASSSEIYGKNSAVPLSEDDDRLLGSTSVGRWSYSDSKAIDEYFAFAYAGKGLPVTIVRYFNAYGPRLDPRGYGSVIAKFITQAKSGGPLTIYGNGRQTRCYTFITDAIEGTVRAANTRDAVGKSFNIGTNHETSVSELSEMICARVNPEATVEYTSYQQIYGVSFEETHRRVPNVERAAQVLGFRAVVPLAEGLEKTITWFGERMIDDVN